MNRNFKVGNFNISGYMVTLIIFWVAITTLSVMAPANLMITRYGVTLAESNLIRASILLPQLFIWVASLYAVLRFYKYTSFLRGSAEGTGFKKIALGLHLLFWVLIIPSVINLISAYNPDAFDIQRATIIARTYITIGFYFAAFWNLYHGTSLLVRTVTINEQMRVNGYKTLAIIMAAFATFYVWAVFHNNYRTISDNPMINPTYHLADWLIILTIIIPYLILGVMAGLTLVNLRGFANAVQGIIYKKAFSSVLYGLMVIVLLTGGLQLMTQAANAFGGASLKIILLVVYLLLFFIALGYLLLAKGARHLTSIEEV